MQNLSIRRGITIILVIMFGLTSVLGGMAIFGLFNVNNSLKTVYDDRLVCIGQQDFVIRSIEQNQYLLQLAAWDYDAKIDTYLAQIDRNQVEVKKVWDQYLSTYIVPEEQMAIDKYQKALADYETKIFNPAKNALRSKDKSLALTILDDEAQLLFFKVRDSMNQLIQLQLKIGNEEYVNSQKNFMQFNVITAVIFLIFICITLFAIVWLKKNLFTPLTRAVELAKTVARGDLTQVIVTQSKNEAGQLINELAKMNFALLDIVSQLREGADRIESVTTSLVQGNTELSGRTENQAANLEETASAMEELTSTVQNNAENAMTANQLVSQASSYAVEGGRVVEDVVNTMGTIKESSSRIVDIIAVIDGIAFQTNILALNAAVEAARAGEQGRGFAVVATEVRSLAQRSANAAKEIKELISNSVETVEAGDKLVYAAGQTMSKAVNSIKQVADLMSEIAAASAEQKAGIEQINDAITDMDQVTQQNTRLVEDASSLTETLSYQAQALTKLVHQFKTQSGGTTHIHPHSAIGDQVDVAERIPRLN